MGNLSNPATPMRQFDDAGVPQEPTQLRQGDSWNWERIFPEYPSNLYSLKYVLNSPRNRFVLDGTLAQNAPIAASDDGQAFLIQAMGTQTQACAPDVYQL